jgi:anti-sigma factor RsiW
VTCSDFLKELTDYLDDSMDAQTRAELEDHLQWCHNCFVICNTTKRTIEIYRDSQLYELPDDLRTRLRSAILAKCHSHKPEPPDAPGPKLADQPGDTPIK